MINQGSPGVPQFCMGFKAHRLDEESDADRAAGPAALHGVLRSVNVCEKALARDETPRRLAVNMPAGRGFARLCLWWEGRPGVRGSGGSSDFALQASALAVTEQHTELTLTGNSNTPARLLGLASACA